MTRYELEINNTKVVTQIELDGELINYCITAFNNSSSVIYRYINTVKSSETIESFYSDTLVDFIHKVDFKTLSNKIIENVVSYNGADMDCLKGKGTEEFKEAYNKLLLIATGSGQYEGSLSVKEIHDNIFTFEIHTYNRNGKMTFDFTLNCKVDLRTKYYRNLINT